MSEGSSKLEIEATLSLPFGAGQQLMKGPLAGKVKGLIGFSKHVPPEGNVTMFHHRIYFWDSIYLVIVRVSMASLFRSFSRTVSRGNSPRIYGSLRALVRRRRKNSAHALESF